MPASSKDAEDLALLPVPASRYVVYFTLAIAGCAVDLLTKSWVFSWLGLPRGDRIHTAWLWPGYVGIQTAVNQGALFGFGQGYSSVFAVLSLLAAVMIVYWLFVKRAAHDCLLATALGLVTAGILGNLYDRMGFWHSATIEPFFRNGVRDWILVQYRDYVWPNFNIADCLLVCGAGLLMWHAFHHREPVSVPDLAPRPD